MKEVLEDDVKGVTKSSKLDLFSLCSSEDNQTGWG